MTNTVTGIVKNFVEYRHIQKDQSAIIDEAGKIDYELTLGSGTGIAQVNKVWYKNKNFTTSDNVDLLNLSFERFGFGFNTAFMGVGSANIKGIHIENSSSYDIGVKLPFPRFNNSYFLVPPSGNVMLSNVRGWEVSSTGAVAQISGNGTSQQYSMSLLGATLPIFISVGNSIPIEYKSSGAFDNIINLEFKGASTSSAGMIPFEYLKTPSGSSSGTIPFEYLAVASGTGIFNMENRGVVNANTLHIPLEWKSSGVGGESSGELVRNNHFLIDGTGSETNYWDGLSDPSSIPPWQLIWPTGSLIQMSNGFMYAEECRRFFAVQRFAPSGDEFVVNYLVLGAPWSHWHRYEYRAKQEIINVQSGVTYNVQWQHELDFPVGYRPTFASKPQFNLWSKNGTLLVSTHYDNAIPPLQDINYQVTAIDDGFVIEFKMPQLPYYASDPVTWRPEIATIPISSWFIRNPSIKHI